MSGETWRGAFYDGLSARRAQVALTFSVMGIGIVADQPEAGVAAIPSLWSYDGLLLTGPPGRDGPLLLGHVDWPGARLSVDDALGLLPLLERRAPDLYRKSGFGGDNRRILGWSLMVLIAAGLAMAGLSFLFGWLAMSLPLEAEQPLGRAVVSAVIGDDARCRNPAGTKALGVMLGRLQPAGDSAGKIHLQVVEDPRINAFAAPGGEIVLFRGLLKMARDPDEVAGVVAHEIGHVEARDATRMVLDQFGSWMLLRLVAGSGGDVGGDLLSLRFSRNAEAAADQRAVDMLNRAHISPQGLVNLFNRLEDSGAAEEGSFLDSHPALADRAYEIWNNIKASPTRPTLDAANWRALKAVCDKP